MATLKSNTGPKPGGKHNSSTKPKSTKLNSVEKALAKIQSQTGGKFKLPNSICGSVWKTLRKAKKLDKDWRSLSVWYINNC